MVTQLIAFYKLALEKQEEPLLIKQLTKRLYSFRKMGCGYSLWQRKAIETGRREYHWYHRTTSWSKRQNSLFKNFSRGISASYSSALREDFIREKRCGSQEERMGGNWLPYTRLACEMGIYRRRKIEDLPKYRRSPYCSASWRPNC